jgi:hypothetical protein
LRIQRTVSELVFAYSTGNRKAVFVEGEDDLAIVEGMLAEFEASSRIAAYTIDKVDVPLDDLTTYGLTAGNRNRVICLSNMIAAVAGRAPKALFCIVDRDYDVFTGKVFYSPCLHFTDHACMEAYCLAPSLLERLFRVAYKLPPTAANDFRVNALRALKAVFAVRAAFLSLEHQVGMPALNKYLVVNGSRVTFRIVAWFRAALQNHGVNNNRLELFGVIKRYLAFSKLLDSHHLVNGHDLVLLTSKWLKVVFNCPPQQVTEDAVGASIRLCLVGEGTASQPLFERLKAFALGTE